MSSNEKTPSEPSIGGEREAPVWTAEERHRELHEAIKAHLLSFGNRDWDRVRSAFPELSSSTIWRHIAIVRAECESRKALGISQLFSPDLAGALKRLREVMSLWREAETVAETAKRADGSIRDAYLLDRSIGTRAKLVAKLVDVTHELRDFEHSTFLDALVEVLAAESPEFRERVIRRMYERFHLAAEAA